MVTYTVRKENEERKQQELGSLSFALQSEDEGEVLGEAIVLHMEDADSISCPAAMSVSKTVTGMMTSDLHKEGNTSLSANHNGILTVCHIISASSATVAFNQIRETF